MSKSLTVTLGGIPLLALRPGSWARTPGARFFQQNFETTAADADKIASIGGPLDLVIASPGRPARTHKNLWVLGTTSGDTPWTKVVIVVDARYWWTQKWIAGDLNMRRKTGDKHLAGEGRIENLRVVDDVAYTPWSLEGTKPWTADRAIRWVMDQLEPGNYQILGKADKRQVVIEDLFFNDRGDFALEKALSYVAGFNVAPRSDGSFVIYDTLDHSEAAMIAHAGPQIAWHGTSGGSDRSNQRPALFLVHFERESELRFDYAEGRDTTLATLDRSGRGQRYLENVIPTTDITLTVAGTGTVSQSSWLTIDDYFDAVKGLWNVPPAPGAMSHAYMREFYVGPMWEFAQNLWAIDNAFQVDPLGAARMRNLRWHWRLSYRPTAYWRGKLRSIRNYRVAIINQATGTHAPAQAFMDYVTFPTDHGIYTRANQNPDIGYQVRGYPYVAGSPNETSLFFGKPAPAHVEIIDPESLVMHVFLKRDPYGESEGFAPGRLTNMPTASISQARAKGNYLLTTIGAAELTSDFKCAIVVACVQAAPNNLGRYHVERVTPADATRVLGEPIGPCNGPPMHIFVPGNIRTARFAWLDQHADAIESAFIDGGNMPSECFVNHNEIRPLAEAAAARVYATMFDRQEGVFAVPINAGLEITGAISVIEDSFDPQGVALSNVVIMPTITPPAEMAFVPPQVQRSIRNLVQVPGVA